MVYVRHIHDDDDIADWQPIETAPRDGTVIDLTWMEDGKPAEIWPMQWGHIQQNGLFPGQVGMWVATDGSCTWSETHTDGAPTHWRLSTSVPCPDCGQNPAGCGHPTCPK